MQTKLSKCTVEYFNEQEFHSLKREIFTNNSYYFETNNPTPTIIDIGAYIGLSVLYFKQIYPDSQIIAFEPNPEAVLKLKENIFNNNIENVEVHNSAIWTEDGIKDLYIDNTDMNRFSVGSFKKGAWNGEVKSKNIRVKCEKLDKYLEGHIDMLKLDVEASEQHILKSIEKYFDKIENIILEYHPIKNQSIEKIVNMLSKKYTIEIYEEGKKTDKNIPKNKLLTIKATYKH